MVHRDRPLDAASVLCLLLSLIVPLAAGSESADDSAPSPFASASICPSRTINYITETLPQQCLRTGWSSNHGVDGKNDSVQDVDGIQVVTIERPTTLAESIEAEHTGTPTPTTSDGASAEIRRAGSPAVLPSQSTSRGEEATKGSAGAEPEQEIDPLSDHANFLSFEEWKAQMLEKAGQSAENIGGARKGETNPEARRRSVGVNQALDSLGDDTEIELDFSGFVSPDSISKALPSSRFGRDEKEQKDEGASVKRSSMSREAGTTSKERFNYASFDCAATILKTNPECKGPNSILLENKDSYMLSPCSTKNKLLIVELCNDILIDTIAIGNYEFFSSTFRAFHVSISDRYPVKLDKWRDIGTFEAKNARGVQAFLVENGLIWARYLRIEFLTHYGNEYYCPVSVLRVHGKTMIDDYRNDVKSARGEDDIEEDEEAVEESGREEVKAEKIVAITTRTVSSAAPIHTEVETKTTGSLPSSTVTHTHHENDGRRGPDHFKDRCPRTNYGSPLIQQSELVTLACASRRKYCNLELTQKINTTARALSKTGSSPQIESQAPMNNINNGSEQSNTAVDASSIKGRDFSENSTKLIPADSYHPQADQLHNGTGSSANGTTVPTNSAISGVANSTTLVPSKTSTQAPAASPPTQESFFKSVHKRLQLLEANTTLSLQYIEEQSRILREAFAKVEKRQLNKTTTFLESLNITVLGELREFRLQYDQIWQSTILELSSQREQSQREAIALSARLTILADEVLWQKRLVYLQFGLILLCLALVMFPRNNTAPYLDLSMTNE